MLPRTQQAYLACVRQLAEHFHKAPEEINPEELRQYFLYLKTERRFNRSTSTQAICAIKMFWEKSLRRSWPTEVELVRATPQFKLPVILSTTEVRHILAAVPALDHRVALTTIYLVPAGGLSLDQRQWVPSRPKFLVHVHPLADHYRTLFRQALERDAPDLLKTLPAHVWKQRWVVHCQPAGSGQAALRYLSRYVFKTATGDRDLPLLPDGRVRWRYRDSTTRRELHLDLEPFELIRRFLQHVLPSGFHRVRRFGWLHPAARAKLNRIRALLHQAPALTDPERAAWQLPAPDIAPPEPLLGPKPTPLCPRCRQPLTHRGSWRPGQPPPRPPARAPP